MNDFNYENEIIEISSDETNNNVSNNEKIEELVSLQPKPKKKKKKGLKDKWNDLSKKTRITIIVISILLVLIALGLVLYFVVLKKDEPIDEPIDEPVVLEKDNYRYENGKLVFLDKSDREIGTYECTNKNTEKCYVAKINYASDIFDRVTSIDENGKEIEKNSQIYFDNYVFIYDNEVISLYNIDDKENELELKNIKTYGTEDNLVVIEDTDSKFGLIEITEEGYEYLIRCSYDNLGIVNSNLLYLIAQDKDKFYIIDSEGKKLSKNINADVMSVNEEYIVAKKNDAYNLYSYEYEELLSDYDYISLHDKVIALVKSNRLYLINNNLSKLNEEGIRLENSDYVKKYVYNENNKLVETKKSFEIEVNDNKALVTINKDTQEINIIEGEVSSNLSYMSYFDGKLYFYSDEEKEDILGTYTCINKNNLENGESDLNNCNIYSNELGISGIYNNEYVFIYDNEDNSTELKYYLYNLKENKSKGTYNSIELLNKDELNTMIKPVYTSSSYIVAKSATGENKGNYGVLEINSEKVSGKVPFKYKTINHHNDYYLLIDLDNKYSIYDSDFKGKNYEFDYIEMFDNYYVGINNNKLNVYEYDSVLGILKNDIKVTNNEFKINFTNGFIITINNNVYKFDKSGNEIKDNILPDNNNTNETEIPETEEGEV